MYATAISSPQSSFLFSLFVFVPCFSKFTTFIAFLQNLQHTFLSADKPENEHFSLRVNQCRTH